MMEFNHMIMVLVMLAITGGISYLVGDLHGFLRGMNKAQEIYEEKRI